MSEEPRMEPMPLTRPSATLSPQAERGATEDTLREVRSPSPRVRGEGARRADEGSQLQRVAELLAYPGAAIGARADDHPEVLEFFAEIARVDPSGLEELYTTTFDLNPVATLEAGWHLWGEQYERGRFLADLRGLQERLGIDAGTELPDHLTVLLPTVAATGDRSLAAQCTGAIDKILAPLEEHGNPYRHLLRAAKEMVQ